jgi:UDP-N-acetyl-L-fucosamine synthase
MTVIGTRPEIIRLSEFIKRADNLRGVKHILVHTGQNYDYELNEIFFEDLGLRKPDYFLNAVGDSPTATIGNILIRIDQLLNKVRPDIIYVLGDTNSSLSAIAAKKHKITVFHSEAGNRSFDSMVPEEFNRKLIDHIADINLPYTQIARHNLLMEGIHPSKILVTGSPMLEVISKNITSIDNSRILDILGLEKGNYYLVSSHREENVSNKNNLKSLIRSLNKLAIEDRLGIVFVVHPRTSLEIKQSKLELNPNITLIKPLGFTDYMRLQLDSKCVLSDSGTISEEASILNFKALNIRYSQERPEAVEKGVLPLVGLEYEDIRIALDYLIDRSEMIEKPVEYTNNNFSIIVINALLSKLY